MDLAKMATADPLALRLRCRVCTILIGDGFVETVPIPSPDGSGVVCSSCDGALQRGVTLTDARGRPALIPRLVLKPEDRPGPTGADGVGSAGSAPIVLRAGVGRGG